MKCIVLLCVVIAGIALAVEHTCNENRQLVYRFKDSSKSQDIRADISLQKLSAAQASQLASIVSGASTLILECDHDQPEWADAVVETLFSHPMVDPSQTVVLYHEDRFVTGLVSDLAGGFPVFLEQHSVQYSEISQIENIKNTLVLFTNGALSQNPKTLTCTHDKIYWVSADMSNERISSIHGLSGNRFGTDYFAPSLDKDQISADLQEIVSTVFLRVVDDNSAGTVSTDKAHQDHMSDFDCDEMCTQTGLVDWNLSCGEISPEIQLSKVAEALDAQGPLLVEFMKNRQQTVSKMFTPKQLKNDGYFDQIDTQSEIRRYNQVSFRNYKAISNPGTDSVEICISDDSTSGHISSVSLGSQSGSAALEIFGESSLNSWKYQEDQLCASFASEYLLSGFQNAQDQLYLSIQSGAKSKSLKLNIDWEDRSIDLDAGTSPRMLALVSQPVVTTVSHSETVFIKVWGVLFLQGKGQYSISGCEKDFSQSFGNVYFDVSPGDGPIFEAFDLSPMEIGKDVDAHYFEITMRTFDTLGVNRLQEKFSYTLQLSSVTGEQQECLHLLLDVDLAKFSDKQTERWLGYKTVLYSDAAGTDPLVISSSSGDHLLIDESPEQWIYGTSSISNSLFEITFEGVSVCISEPGNLARFNPFSAVSHECEGVWKDAYPEGFEVLSEEAQKFTFRLRSPKKKDASMRINWDVTLVPGSAVDQDRLFSDRFGNPLQMFGHKFQDSDFGTMESNIHYIIHQQKASQSTYGFPYARKYYAPLIASEIDISDNLNFAHIELLALGTEQTKNHQQNARSISLFNYDDDDGDDDDNWFQAYFSSSSRDSEYISYLQSILDSLMSSSESSNSYSSEEEHYNETSSLTSSSYSSVVLTNSSSSSSNSSTGERESKHTDHHHRHKHVVLMGIVVVTIVAIILILCCAFMCYRMYEENQEEVIIPRQSVTKTIPVTQKRVTKTKTSTTKVSQRKTKATK